MPTTPTRRTVLAGAAAGTLATPFIGRAAAAAPFFKLFFMIPNNQAARMAWGTLAARQMTQIGIDVVSSYVPFSSIYPRRNKGDGKTYPDGGWDVYLERYYYSSIKPTPNQLFSSKVVPPAGENYYYLEDPVLDRAMDGYAGSVDPTVQHDAMEAFEKRWYDTEPLTILFYPEDIIATNPKLSGFDATTFRPVFYPQPERWTIPGDDDATATFACWPPPDSALPMFGQGYQDSNTFGPVYDQLLAYDSWERKNLVPALAEKVEESADGRIFTISLRPDVKWHSGEPFTAADVRFTWETILNPAFASDSRGVLQAVLGSIDAVRIDSPLQLTVTLPAYSMMMREFVLSALAIMPQHAYADIKPEAMRGHVVNTWRGSFTVKTSSGSYTSKGGIGTGPWIAQGFDPTRRAYKYTRNPHYWKATPGNVKTYYLVNIQGTDAVLAALKSGDIDAHDPMYDVGPLASTIDASWGKVLRFDSFKWQHICYNLRHPVIGTGVDTPLGRQDPTRAAEAAAYVRKAISFATPREQIIKQMAGGYGQPGTVPLPFSAPEYDHDMLKPIPFDMDLAKQYMTKAGYQY